MSWADLDQEQRDFITATLTRPQLEVFQHRLHRPPISWAKIALDMNLDEATVRGHHKRAIRRIANARKDEAA